jgi:hypothetical protein
MQRSGAHTLDDAFIKLTGEELVEEEDVSTDYADCSV